jgi:hypothetical protein
VIFVSLFGVAVLSPVVTAMERRFGWSQGLLISRATMTDPNRNASSACRVAVRRTALVVRLVSETW